MSIKTKQTWLAVGATVLLAGGAPGFVAPGMMNTVQAQNQKITGTVVDDLGEPVTGANIRVKGTTRGTITDLDGKFSLDAAAGETLEISFIGYATQTVKAANGLNITLREDSQSLEDVVVVGYGVQKKKLVTGATVQVKGEDVAKLNTSNALTAMQASTPGVNITQSSSQPGKGFKVNIRGVGTIGESSPLLIIDGVQSGTANDGLNGLNPNDIESIDVLKDAASAAIYGARAANGVILVTTKQGKAGKVTTQYDGFVGWSNPYKRPNTLNAQEYMEICDEVNYNTTGMLVDWSTKMPANILQKVNSGWEGTDWFEFYRNKNAIQHSHALSVTGGTDRSKFAISLNYSKQEGIMGKDNASNYERYGGRINSDHVLLKSKDGKRDVIKFGENLSYWFHASHDLAEGNGYWSVTQPLYKASPLVPIFDEDGNIYDYSGHGNGWDVNIFTNPYASFLAGGFNALNKNRDFGVGATFFVEIEPIKGLKYRGQFNTGYSGWNGRNISLPYSSGATSSSASYGLGQSQGQSSSMSLEHTLAYTLPELAGHHIDVLVGQSTEASLWSTDLSVNASASGDDMNSLIKKGWDYQILGNYDFAQVTGASGGDYRHQYNIASYFGRVNWNYMERYMATFTFRRDGSKNFAKGNRWGNFPSVSAGWVITNESWAESVTKVMDFLKLRASWGQNGNQSIANFRYISNINFSPSGYADYGYKFDSSIAGTVAQNQYVTGAYASNAPNPDVKWETSEQLNIGLDARFLESRLGLAFDWYKKTTKDWLVSAPMNQVLGYESAAMINGGDVENTGFEIALNWNDNIGKDFRYHANVNFATNKNEVTRLATPSGRIGDNVSSALFQNSSYVSLVQKGEPIGFFSGMSTEGIWQNQAQIEAARAAGKAVLADAVPGDPIWCDYNGDGVIEYDSDRHKIGNPHPDFTLGISLGFDWKGLDFNVTGSGAFGQQVMQYYRTAQLQAWGENYTTDIYDRWHGEGTSNSKPRLVVGGNANQWVSDLYMQDADFFKIQNITLGYDFNKLIKNSPFGQVRAYVQGQNLFTFTGYTGVDPEVGSNGGNGDGNWVRGIDVGTYPSARTFIVGLSVKF